jgi:hypothetical protein
MGHGYEPWDMRQKRRITKSAKRYNLERGNKTNKRTIEQ